MKKYIFFKHANIIVFICWNNHEKQFFMETVYEEKYLAFSLIS